MLQITGQRSSQTLDINESKSRTETHPETHFTSNTFFLLGSLQAEETRLGIHWLCLFALRLCRLKKKAQGEVNATAISNLLPFIEYELHTQLMNKLKLRSMNALFGLHIQISVGENMLLGLAVGFLPAVQSLTLLVFFNCHFHYNPELCVRSQPQECT